MAKIVEVTKQGLESDIHNGLSRKEMATKYGISTITLASVLKQVGLSNKRGPQVIVKIVDVEEYNNSQYNAATDSIVEDNIPEMASNFKEFVSEDDDIVGEL